MSADVIVLGFGSAGVAAAIAASDAGASVLVLEKQSADRHSPSAKAAGSYVLSAVDESATAQYLAACAGGLVARTVTDAWAQHALSLPDWLVKAAPELTYVQGAGMHAGAAHRALPGADGVRTLIYRAPEAAGYPGAEFYQALQASAMSRPGVRVRWGMRARRLLRDRTGAVIGVRAERSDGSRSDVLAGAVVLATGGFEGDEALKAAYLPAHPMHFGGNPANTGDGLRMAIDVGADLWHMNGAEGRQCLHVIGDDGTPLNFQMSLLPGGFVVVDRAGQRFCDEYRYTRIHTLWYEMLAFDAESRTHPRIPSYWILDRRRFAAAPLTPPGIGPGGMGLYRWSADNCDELARGWIAEGATVAEAAGRAGIADPAAAESTVAAFNAACAGGADKFGRTEGLVPLDEPPYYVVALHPGGVSTTGGPRHDEHGRVMDVFDAPVPGLYSAGTVGQMIGTLYPGPGSGWSEALCAGRMAGAAAALDWHRP